MSNDEDNFIEISKRCGEKFDLVQTGGGNSSLKIDSEIMLIKSSGVSLSDIVRGKGYTKFNYKKALIMINRVLDDDKNHLRKDLENISKDIVNQCLQTGESRPSIEVLVHCLVGKFAIHLHPIWLTNIVSQKKCLNILEKLLIQIDRSKWELIDYKTPGIEVALEVLTVLKKRPNIEILFLKNHGLFLTGSDSQEIMKQLSFLEILFTKDGSADEKFKFNLRKIIGDEGVIFKSHDLFILNCLKDNFNYMTQLRPLLPDDLVYWGAGPVVVNHEENMDSIVKYLTCFGEPPKVVIYQECIYFCNSTLSKAKSTEEMFKAHLLGRNFLSDDLLDFLSRDEILYLLGWEAEKYRRELKD